MNTSVINSPLMICFRQAARRKHFLAQFVLNLDSNDYLADARAAIRYCDKYPRLAEGLRLLMDNAAEGGRARDVIGEDFIEEIRWLGNRTQ